MLTFLQDLRYGLRALAKSPVFAGVAVAALALGIGANSAIFSVVDAVLLRPLPFDGASRLVTIQGRNETQGGTFVEQSYPNFVDLREQCQVCEGAAAYSGVTTFLFGTGEPERVRGAQVSADIFPMLGVQPAHGRPFTRDEDKPGAARTVVLSHGLWQRHYGGDPAIVGRAVPLGSQPATVVGVMPPGFKFPVESEQVDFWFPLASLLAQSDLTQRDAVSLNVVAKLKANVSEEQAQAELATIGRRLAAQYPETNTGVAFWSRPLRDYVLGDMKTALLVLLGAVGCVLLIACANVANLLLARAASRAKEISIRTALGASRARIVRQLLTESLILSAAGGAFGLLAATWGVDLLVAASPANLPGLGEVGLDARVVLFTVALTILTAVVFGLAPAVQASKSDVTDALKEGGRGGSEGARRNRLRSALVVAEVAISLVLLVGAGLLGQSFRRLLDVTPGFDPANVVTMDVVPRAGRYPQEEQRVGFFRDFLARAAQAPGVEAVGLVNPLPLGGGFETWSFQIEGREPPPPGQGLTADRRIISPEYFRAMRIPVLRGRAFDDRDRRDAPLVVVVNESFARRHFPGEDPLGRRVRLGEGEAARVLEIVGVVGDVRHAGLDAETSTEFYLPYTQSLAQRMTIVGRAATGDAAAVAATLRAVIRESDKDSPIWNVRTMEELLDRSVARRRFNMILFGAFAAVALLLAALGIYGVISYSVTQRTHEIGVRVALGARPRDVLRMIVGQGMALTLLGVAVGLVGAFFLTRVMASLLYGVSATDPPTFAGVAVVLSLVALVSCYLPARRATKVDPMEALRYE